jgi:uncharacterized protein YceK
MKNFSFIIVACAVVLSGCASPQTEKGGGGCVAEETYTPTGTMIPRKKKDARDNQSVDMQQLENERNNNNGVNNSGR